MGLAFATIGIALSPRNLLILPVTNRDYDPFRQVAQQLLNFALSAKACFEQHALSSVPLLAVETEHGLVKNCARHLHTRLSLSLVLLGCALHANECCSLVLFLLTLYNARYANVV